MPPTSYSYLGEIFIVPYNFSPLGSNACDGSVLAINTNTALFSLLGTTYGGNGTTNFNLPDLRSRLVVGAGQGSGLTNRILGATGGQETVTLTTAQIPAHGHALAAAATPGNAQTPAGTSIAEAHDNTFSTQAPAAAMNAASIGSTGGGTAHENMPPWLALQFVISMSGIFPARN